MTEAVTSYSQYGEDAVIADLFGARTGRLLEIGAWDPKQFSNSRLLIERGWSAILIEPSPGPLQRLVREYGDSPNVTVIAAAVTPNEAGVIKLRVTDDAVSTGNARVQETWTESGGYYGSLWVPSISVAALFNQFGGFNFISVDAEGLSVEIAAAIFGSGVLPEVMIVEHDGRLVELQQHAQQRGYRAVHTNGTNVVLARI